VGHRHDVKFVIKLAHDSHHVVSSSRQMSSVPIVSFSRVCQHCHAWNIVVPAEEIPFREMELEL
jgi:hypothetical protein